MTRPKNLNFGTAVLFALAALSGCSLSSSSGDPSLHIDLSSLKDRSGQFALLNSGGPLYGLVAPPASATGFSCYAVNVTGPGIFDTSGHPEQDPMIVFNRTLTVPGNYCSYRGVVTPPIYLSGTGTADVALQVPPGGVRLVQIVGVNDSLVCASGAIDGAGGGGSKYFEIGRGVVYDLFGDRSVEITKNWPSGATSADQLDRAKRTLDCGGGNCGNIYDYTSGGAAAAFMIGNMTSKYAQRIPTVAGKYIRKGRFYLNPSSAAVNATVTLWSSTAGTPPSAPTSYSASVNLAASTPATWIDFDFYNASFGYLQMQSGSDYWAVISSSDANSGASKVLEINHGADTGSADDANVQIFSAGWSPSSGQTDGIYSQVYGCSQ